MPAVSIQYLNEEKEQSGKKKKSYSHFLCNSYGMQSEQFFYEYEFIARVIDYGKD